MSNRYYHYRLSKKIRNLTVGQIVRTCKNFECVNCPLNQYCGDFESYLDKRVYIHIKYDRQVKSTK